MMVVVGDGGGSGGIFYEHGDNNNNDNIHNPLFKVVANHEMLHCFLHVKGSLNLSLKLGV